METKICIIGAGPAGLMSAIFAAKAGAKTVVIEKNTAAGNKLLLTGGGRCNITHTGTVEDFVKTYGRFGRLLKHALYEFTPDETIEFFNELGIATKTEPDPASQRFAVASGCIFPESERASEVKEALLGQCKKLNVQFVFGRGVEKITQNLELKTQNYRFAVFAGKDIITAQKVIIATGGLSYPATGSTGDGFKLAKSLGHTIVEPKAALVPLIAEEKWCYELGGTSLDKVNILTVINKKKIAIEGPLVFTQDGIGGPAVLDMSRMICENLPSKIFIDLLPSMNETKLEEYLIELFTKYSRKIVINPLVEIIPKRIAGLICRQVGIAETLCNQLKKEQRRSLVQLLKKLPLTIIKTRPIDEATITRGGVSNSEIDSKTMQSKICLGLYFAGEVIDADGPCGGYNLQICWSTGALAGRKAAEEGGKESS